MSRTRTLLMCGAAALTLAAASHDPVAAAGRVEVALTDARVDMIEKDSIVASFNATGSIRGLFTATIVRENGGVRGEWALVSRYLRDVTPDGQPDALAADERAALPGWELHTRHKEYFEIVEGGTLRGSIAGGSLSFDVDGRLRGIESLQLSIDGGNKGFAGLKGSGSLSGSNLQSEAGVGSIRFSPESAQSEVN
jgi:hypothetical protein